MIIMAFLRIVFFTLILTYGVNSQGRGALRLVRNNHYSTIQAYTSGIVEIYYAGGWGNICDDAYAGYTEANVICNQLGFNGVSSYGSAGYIAIYGTDTNSMKIEDVSCFSSSYLSLLSQCTFSPAYSSFCLFNHNYDLYVSCYITKIWNNNPYNGQIRLFGGTYSNQGRLEVYCNGQWGTVCDDTFDATDAFIACHQLGYNSYNQYWTLSSSVGSTSQPIWLDSLTGCSSSSSCLAYCESCPLREYHDCIHSEDVALECEYTSSRSRIYTRLSTCQYASSSGSGVGGIVGGIIGGVVAGFIILLCLIALSVGIPICICVSRRNKRRRPVTVTVAAAAGTPSVGLSRTVPYMQLSSYPDENQSYPNQYPDQSYPDQPYPNPDQH